MSEPTTENPRGLSVTIVNVCLRAGRGGSPTAVLDENGLGDTVLDDEERCGVPVLAGTSHAVFVSRRENGSDPPEVSLRFFTATGELPACGHGTLAALAFLAARAENSEYHTTLHTPGRTFTGGATRVNGRIEAAFEAGPTAMGGPVTDEHGAVLSALGVTADLLAPGAALVSSGRGRLLVPVLTRPALTALAPDFDRLRVACDRLGLLGCYVYCGPNREGRVTARMFAPSIGVPEDIANVNSTVCLAAHLVGRGFTTLTVDMGDSLRTPSTITTTVRTGRTGPTTEVSGAATIAHILLLRPHPGAGADPARLLAGERRSEPT